MLSISIFSEVFHKNENAIIDLTYLWNTPFTIKDAVLYIIIVPRHLLSNNVVCATSKGSDQTARMRSLIRAFASRLNIL